MKRVGTTASCAVWCVAVLILSAATISAQPLVTDMQPRGAQKGRPFTLTLTGAAPVDVSAVGVAVLSGNEDIANARLEFGDGCVANLTASRVSQDRVRKIRFFSREAYISVDTKEQEVKGYRLAGKTVLPIEVTVTKKEPLRAELEAFIECVRTRTRPLVSGEDGLAAVELAIRVAKAIDESLKRFLSLPS